MYESADGMHLAAGAFEPVLCQLVDESGSAVDVKLGSDTSTWDVTAEVLATAFALRPATFRSRQVRLFTPLPELER